MTIRCIGGTARARRGADRFRDKARRHRHGGLGQRGGDGDVAGLVAGKVGHDLVHGGLGGGGIGDQRGQRGADLLERIVDLAELRSDFQRVLIGGQRLQGGCGAVVLEALGQRSAAQRGAMSQATAASHSA